jgi:hypothetical protein
MGLVKFDLYKILVYSRFSLDRFNCTLQFENLLYTGFINWNYHICLIQYINILGIMYESLTIPESCVYITISYRGAAILCKKYSKCGLFLNLQPVPY